MKLEILLAIVLVLNLISVTIFILQKKSQSAKMLVSMLLSSIGVGLLLLLYEISKEHALLDVALIFVFLSSATAILFAKRLHYRSAIDKSGKDNE